MLVNLLQPENAKLPILFTVSGITMFVKPQQSNAKSPIFVKLSGNSKLLKFTQERNAFLPILSTFPLITIVVKPLQLMNAFSPIFPLNIVTLFIEAGI